MALRLMYLVLQVDNMHVHARICDGNPIPLSCFAFIATQFISNCVLIEFLCTLKEVLDHRHGGMDFTVVP